MEMGTAYCEECDKIISYKTKYENVLERIHGCDCSYRKVISYCPVCNSEVFVEKYEEENLSSLIDSYKSICNIISIEKINEMLVRYNVGKRPFSLIIGLSELSITNYLNGKTPSKVNNELLIEVFNNPEKYKALLKKNKNLIAEITYKKSLDAVNSYIRTQKENEIKDSKIQIIAAYIISECEDITQLMLQKMLYYVQALYAVFYKTFLFTEDCEAWVHGPVYRVIYEKYKDYHYDSLNDIDIIKPEVTTDEKIIVDTVIKYFGCYSGPVLEKFTHLETPWLETRRGISENERSNRIIKKDLIQKYFKENIGMDNNLFFTNVENYSKKLFNRIVGS